LLPSLLLADDDDDILAALSDMLSDRYRLTFARDGGEAMAALRLQLFDLAIVDLGLPAGEDGYTFIRKLRTLGRDVGGETPALALTALAGEGDHQQSLAAGFQMHLTKPVDIASQSEAVIRLAEGQPGG